MKYTPLPLVCLNNKEPSGAINTAVVHFIEQSGIQLLPRQTIVR